MITVIEMTGNRVRQVGAFCLVSATLAVGCATTTSYRMLASSTVPAASGSVGVSTGDDEDNDLSIHVENLADPSTLSPAASAYVVWVAPPGEAAQNVGSLQVDGHSGSLSTATPLLHDFVVSITPELEAQAIAPSGPEVLSVTVHR